MKKILDCVFATAVAFMVVFCPHDASADSRVKFSSSRSKQRKVQNVLQQIVAPAVQQLGAAQQKPMRYQPPVRYQQQIPQRAAPTTYQQQRPVSYGAVNTPVAQGTQGRYGAVQAPKKVRQLGPFAKKVAEVSDAIEPYAKTALLYLSIPCLIFILVAGRRGEGRYVKKVAKLSIIPGVISVIYGMFIDDWSMVVGERFIQAALLFEALPIIYACWAITQMSGGIVYRMFALVFLILISLFAVLLSALITGILIALLIAVAVIGGMLSGAKESIESGSRGSSGSSSSYTPPTSSSGDSGSDNMYKTTYRDGSGREYEGEHRYGSDPDKIERTTCGEQSTFHRCLDGSYENWLGEKVDIGD